MSIGAEKETLKIKSLLSFIPCQNSLLSEQLLSDVPHEKGLMFNAKLTYLKIFHATLDFDLAEGYDRAVKS